MTELEETQSKIEDCQQDINYVKQDINRLTEEISEYESALEGLKTSINIARFNRVKQNEKLDRLIALFDELTVQKKQHEKTI